MNIKIKEKIEQINKEPEHVRMKYVWICVAVSMFVIFIVWIFSIVSMFTNKQSISVDNNSSGFADTQKQFQDLKEQASTLKSLNDQSIGAINEDNTNQQSSPSSSPSSRENVNLEIPQSNSYSNIYNPNGNTSAQQ